MQLLTNEDPGTQGLHWAAETRKKLLCSRSYSRSHHQLEQLLLRPRFLTEEVCRDKVFKFMYLENSLGQCNIFLHLQPLIGYSSLWTPGSVHSRLFYVFSFFQVQGLCTLLPHPGKLSTHSHLLSHFLFIL